METETGLTKEFFEQLEKKTLLELVEQLEEELHNTIYASPETVDLLEILDNIEPLIGFLLEMFPPSSEEFHRLPIEVQKALNYYTSFPGGYVQYLAKQRVTLRRWHRRNDDGFPRLQYTVWRIEKLVSENS